MSLAFQVAAAAFHQRRVNQRWSWTGVRAMLALPSRYEGMGDSGLWPSGLSRPDGTIRPY